MSFSPEDIRANRDFFAEKLKAIKQRNDVLRAVEKKAMDFVLLDVRAREAFEGGHIPGARCAPESQLDEIVAQLPKDKELVVYCWSHD